MTPVLVGLAVGAAGAVTLSRLVQSLLFDVRPTHPVIYGSVLALLGVAALLACYVPARRALRIDPIETLRRE